MRLNPRYNSQYSCSVPLIYVSSLIETPPEAIREINDIIQNFIWERKTAKIAQNTYTNIEYRARGTKTMPLSNKGQRT